MAIIEPKIGRGMRRMREERADSHTVPWKTAFLRKRRQALISNAIISLTCSNKAVKELRWKQGSHGVDVEHRDLIFEPEIGASTIMIVGQRYDACQTQTTQNKLRTVQSHRRHESAANDVGCGH
jgi:hypothetical protein